MLIVQGVAAFAAAFVVMLWNVHGGVRWFALGAYCVAVLWLLTWVFRFVALATASIYDDSTLAQP